MKKIIKSIKEAYNELVYKVSWPTRAELTSSAVIVMVAALVLATIVFGIDKSFATIMKFFYTKIF